MRKIALFICVVMCVMLVCPFVSSASHQGITANAPVTVPNATPTVDGAINASEGWSSVAYLNYDTAGFFWGPNTYACITAELYYAYDANGIYFAANILELGQYTYFSEYENQDATDYIGYIESTGLDDIDSDSNGVKHGFNGDTFIFALDPGKVCDENGVTGNTDYTPWYCVSIENGETKMYRTQVNEGYVTGDDGKVAGMKNASTDAKGGPVGWCFEAFLSWETIAKDFNDLYADEFKDDVTAAKLSAAGASHYAGAMYIDRYYDEEGGQNDTRARYCVVKEMVAGVPGNASDGVSVATYGIDLTLDGNGASADTTAATADTTAAAGGAATTTAAGGAATTTAAKTTTAAQTTKPAETSAPAGQATAAQTFDAGIAVAIGTVLASGIAIVSVKKAKKK